MTRADLDLAVDWAAAEGWNPGLHDADCFYTADPSGFLLGWLGNDPIAAISVVKYGEAFGFLGFYIVKPEFRGQGYGWQLWQAGLASLGDRCVGLDGVVAQQANYLKSGFHLAYRNIRYEGHGQAEPSPPPASPEFSQAAVNLVPVADLALDTVLAYDRGCFPAERSAFLQAWLQQPGSTAIAAVQADQTDQLWGYGLIRPCRQGYKIGPLFANDGAIAEALFLALRAQVPAGEPFYLDVPEVNPDAMAIAVKYQLTNQFETARMYRPTLPNFDTTRIFGVTSFELG